MPEERNIGAKADQAVGSSWAPTSLRLEFENIVRCRVPVAQRRHEQVQGALAATLGELGNDVAGLAHAIHSLPGRAE